MRARRNNLTFAPEQHYIFYGWYLSSYSILQTPLHLLRFLLDHTADKRREYIQALCRELEMRKDYLQGEDIETIYLGGGTPSQLEKEDFEQLFETIFRIYPVNDQAEITLEANPDDLTPEYLKMLSQQPFNRLSMGIQTFNEHTLKLLHRRHTAQQP